MRWAVVCVLAGCSFHAHEQPHDASNDAAGDGPTDAPIDTPPRDCLASWLDHTIDFHAPAPLAELNGTGYDRDPFLSPDERTIYFSTTRAGTMPPGQADVYTAHRAQLGDPFDTPVAFAPATTADGFDTKVSFTTDGLDLFVGSTHGGGAGQVDVWEATRSSSLYGALQQDQLDSVNDFANQQDPTISGDGLALYEAPDSSGRQLIVVATRGDRSDSFESPQVLDELVDPGGYGTADPALSTDQRIILVSSARAGTAGGGDLWYATRATPADRFSAPIHLPAVNTPANEGDPHLSADGCRLYFASDRDLGMDWDLFVAAAR